MKYAEFERILRDQLYASWGQKSYPPVNVAHLWRYVQDITPSELMSGLDAVALIATRAPTIGQVRGACLTAINRAVEARKREMARKASEGNVCVYCGGHGWIYGLPYENPLTEFAFICSYCPAPSLLGITTSHGARAWKPEDAEAFFLRRFDSKSDETAAAMQLDASAKILAKMRAKLEVEVARRVESGGMQTIKDLLGELPF